MPLGAVIRSQLILHTSGNVQSVQTLGSELPKLAVPSLPCEKGHVIPPLCVLVSLFMTGGMSARMTSQVEAELQWAGTCFEGSLDVRTGVESWSGCNEIERDPRAFLACLHFNYLSGSTSLKLRCLLRHSVCELDTTHTQCGTSLDIYCQPSPAPDPL